MVDIHSHILPEVDDGAQSWEMAEHMCQMAARDGIEHMVATPHANGEYSYDREWLRGVLNELRQRIGDKPKLSLGCDFHLSYENLESLAKDPHRYTIENTPYLLVEFSDFSIPPSINDELEDLLLRRPGAHHYPSRAQPAAAAHAGARAALGADGMRGAGDGIGRYRGLGREAEESRAMAVPSARRYTSWPPTRTASKAGRRSCPPPATPSRAVTAPSSPRR